MPSPDPIPRPLDHVLTLGRADDLALATRDLSFTYSELEAAVGRLAAALLAYGLNAGDRVATWLPKTIEACLMPLAAARAGLIHVPINPVLKRVQALHILEDSGAKLLLTGQGRADALGTPPCSLWLEPQGRQAWKEGTPLPPSDHDANELAAILYTSGSTGRPKGVMLSHANLWLGAISVAHYLKLGREDRILGVLPLSFDYGQNQFLSGWAAGSCITPVDYLTARDVIRAAERFSATTLAGVPPLWVQLIEAEWPEDARQRIRRVTNSGGALTPSLIEKLRKVFENTNIYPMYGLTEAFRSTYLNPALVEAHPTSMGTEIPFAEVLVVRPDGSLAADGEPGELVHCGPLVAQGYWQDADRTAQRFRPAPPPSRYGGTAVWSGDTVRREADGLLYFSGRDDEMIKVSGNRISPTEIEEVALASGAALEAVALGIPDERLGQAILLVVRGDGNEAEARLSAYLKAELPAFMQPREVVWRAELPRNPNGKLDRAGLKAELAS